MITVAAYFYISRPYCKKVTINFDQAIKAIAIEINLKKGKWILIGSYNPHKDMIKNHLKSMESVLNDLCLKYDNCIPIADFNSEMHEYPMNNFCTTNNLKHLVKEMHEYPMNNFCTTNNLKHLVKEMHEYPMNIFCTTNNLKHLVKEMHEYPMNNFCTTNNLKHLVKEMHEYPMNIFCTTNNLKHLVKEMHEYPMNIFCTTNNLKHLVKEMHEYPMNNFCTTNNLKHLVKEMHEYPMNNFCTTNNLKHLVKEPTCFKNIESPSCIDLILINKPLYFQNTNVLETGISDFHKLTLTIMKSSFYKQEPKYSTIEITKVLIMKVLGITYFMRSVKRVFMT